MINGIAKAAQYIHQEIQRWDTGKPLDKVQVIIKSSDPDFMERVNKQIMDYSEGAAFFGDIANTAQMKFTQIRFPTGIEVKFEQL